jgi:hypothetical protein
VYHELPPRTVVRARPGAQEVVLGLHERQEGGGEVMALEDGLVMVPVGEALRTLSEPARGARHDARRHTER